MINCIQMFTNTLKIADTTVKVSKAQLKQRISRCSKN